MLRDEFKQQRIVEILESTGEHQSFISCVDAVSFRFINVVPVSFLADCTEIAM